MTSTNEIDALIIDDLESNIASIRGRLDIQFQRLGVQVHWDATNDPDEGIRKMLAHEYDLVVADMLFPRTDEVEEGDRHQPRLDLVTTARTKSDETYILAITSRNPDWHRRLTTEATDAGANLAIERRDFAEYDSAHSPAILAEGVLRHLVSLNRLTTIDVHSNPPRDSRVAALLGLIGTSTLAELYRLTLDLPNWGNTSSLSVSYIAPGASGSFVCRVDVSLDGLQTAHVLKVGRDRHLLAREITRGRRLAALLPPRSFVQHLSKRPVGDIGGWYAIAIPVAHDTDNLRAWLRHSADSSAAVTLVDALFRELRNAYISSRQTTTVGPTDDLVLDGLRTILVSDALQELREPLGRASGMPDVELDKLCRSIESFTRHGQIGDRPSASITKPHWRCMVHGDLHAANTLVYRGPAPSITIIDSSEVGINHWAEDGARLHVDLLLNGISTRTDAMFWDEWRAWRVSAVELSKLGSTDPIPALPALAAAQWLSRNVPSWALPSASGADRGDYEWSWHACLAAQYARATYRQALPSPIRTLAAAAAHDQLEIASSML